MSLLDGPLRTVFGTVLGALFQDATLHKMVETDTGGGGFATTSTEYPVKASADAIGAADQAASGLPANAVRFTILLAGVPAVVDLDDSLTIGGATYRIIKVDTDPAGAATVAAAVPA